MSQPRLPPSDPASPLPASTAIGTRLVLGLVLLALGLAAFAVWFQWGQTRRCLAFYGPAAARSIQAAPRVELWSLAADRGGVRAEARLDISRAPGLVHLRRGLIEDVNFRWNDVRQEGGADPARGRLAPAEWDEAIAFFAAARIFWGSATLVPPNFCTTRAIDMCSLRRLSARMFAQLAP